MNLTLGKWKSVVCENTTSTLTLHNNGRVSEVSCKLSKECANPEWHMHITTHAGLYMRHLLNYAKWSSEWMSWVREWVHVTGSVNAGLERISARCRMSEEWNVHLVHLVCHATSGSEETHEWKWAQLSCTLTLNEWESEMNIMNYTMRVRMRVSDMCHIIAWE